MPAKDLVLCTGAALLEDFGAACWWPSAANGL